jgi:lysophospholipase L1-like esterase
MILPAIGPSADHRHAVVRVLAAGCDAAAIALLAFLIVSRLFYERFHMTREFEFDRVLLIGLAIALVVLARLARHLDVRLLLAATTLTITAGAALAIAIVRSTDVAGTVKSAIFAVVVREHDPDIAKPDERYGYVLRPNARDRHRSADFDVMYTIDADGWRVTRAPAQPRETIVFVGDSFTFGTGVEDNQSFSSLLGAEYWTDVKVVNAGVGGWGVTQGYLAIADLLAKAPPTAIVYQMIPDDIYRSYLRTPVTTGVRRRLEFVGGRLEMRDVTPGPAATVTPELVGREVRMAIDLLLAMQALCAKHHVPFAVLLLLDQGSYPTEIGYALGEHHFQTVVPTGLRYERFTHDYHPNPADHRRIAAAIASSTIGEMVHEKAVR